MKVSIRVGFGTPEKEGQHPVDPVLQGVSELGFDGIELMLRPGRMWGPRQPQPWSPTLTKEDRAEVVRLAQRHGVEIATLSADWAWGYAQYCPHIDHWDRGVQILKGDIELAGRALRIPIAAVTGTNGKTTTVLLLEAMLRAAGLRARAAGNVGRPARGKGTLGR